MKKLFVSFSLLALLAASCKKDDTAATNEPVTPTKENLAGTYKITAATAGGVNVYDNPNPTLNMLEPCQRDNPIKLNTDLTYQVTDAGTVCSPADNYSGTWALVNATTINMDGETSTITSFNGKKLVLTDTYFSTTIVTTYEKQ